MHTWFLAYVCRWFSDRQMTERTWLKYLKQLSWLQNQQKQHLNRHFAHALSCNKMKCLVTGHRIRLKQNCHFRRNLLYRWLTLPIKHSLRQQIIPFGLQELFLIQILPFSINDWWAIFFVFLWMEDSSLGKENKCCKQLCKLTAAGRTKQTGQSVTLTALSSSQGVHQQTSKPSQFWNDWYLNEQKQKNEQKDIYPRAFIYLEHTFIFQDKRKKHALEQTLHRPLIYINFIS